MVKEWKWVISSLKKCTINNTYRMRHEIQVWKCRSKIGSIDIGLPCTLWKKETMTTGTKYINGIVSWQIRQSHWQHWLTLTKDLWTSPKRCCTILFIHCVHSSIRHYIPSVNQAIQHFLSQEWYRMSVSLVKGRNTVNKQGIWYVPPRIRQSLVVPTRFSVC
jgi:hypothetical protein